jgi:ribonuclease P protein component
MQKATYKRAQKLKSRKQIELLFSKKQSISVYPIRISYLITNGEASNEYLKAGVGSSKRNFKRAVDRNRVKRLLRESFRLHKLPLEQYLTEKQTHLITFFHYYSRTILTQEEQHEKMKIAIDKLVALLNETLA